MTQARSRSRHDWAGWQTKTTPDATRDAVVSVPKKVSVRYEGSSP